jgi:curved DNA-binding protein CbpA
LGLTVGASQSEIKKAYRELIIKWHPDKNPDNLIQAELMSKNINAAYTVLKN